MNERRVTAFAKPADFRAWLAKNHATTRELLVRCYKVHAAHKGVTYSQALDEALCYGWIDGVRRSVDDDSFSVRFSPRKPKSYWSLMNISRARALEAGTHTAAGARRISGARPRHPKARFGRETRRQARRGLREEVPGQPARVDLFSVADAIYQRMTTFWIMSTKQEGTRQRRLDLLIDCAARGTTIPLLRRTPK